MEIKKEKIKKVFLKIFGSIAKHAFFASLVLFIIAFFFGVWLFNKCNIITQTEDFENIEGILPLDNKVYERVLGNWQENEERFIKVDFKEYLNPFLKMLDSTLKCNTYHTPRKGYARIRTCEEYGSFSTPLYPHLFALSY